jgi:serine/threonine protein kinase
VLETTAAREETWALVQQSLSSTGHSGERDHSVRSTCELQSEHVRPSSDLVLKLLAPTDDPRMLGRLGGYEIVGLIGSGGMGVVLKGFDSALNRYQAIKVLAPHLAESGSARRRFAREAQAAAAVVHENVVAIHGVDQWNGLPFLVMPYERGPTLQKRLDDEGPLQAVEILRIAVQAAPGLAAAHAQGLVHRDVKPANILLDEGVERVKLTDFGLARAADDASLTRTGVIAGTPQFMSPEQAIGDSIDERSDLFSLGSVMYTMCTGRPPFRAETSYGVLRRITDSQPRPIREINPDIPDWLCRVIERLHAKSRDDRFQSAAEAAELLGQCLAHVQQPDVQPLPSSLEQVSRPVDGNPRRRRGTSSAGSHSLALRACIVFAGLVVVVAIAAFVAMNANPFARHESQERDATVKSQLDSAPQDSQSAFATPTSESDNELMHWHDDTEEQLLEIDGQTEDLETRSFEFFDDDLNVETDSENTALSIEGLLP